MISNGQTVNIASRVQGLAAPRAIVVTEQVVENTQASMLLESTGLEPTLRRATLSGIADEMSVYEIPLSAAAPAPSDYSSLRTHFEHDVVLARVLSHL